MNRIHLYLCNNSRRTFLHALFIIRFRIGNYRLGFLCKCLLIVSVQPIRLIKPCYRISPQETELFTNGFHSKQIEVRLMVVGMYESETNGNIMCKLQWPVHLFTSSLIWSFIIDTCGIHCISSLIAERSNSKVKIRSYLFYLNNKSV